MLRGPQTLILALLAAALVCRVARADGGAVRFDGERGGYRIVAFTLPTPLRAGPMDLSVLVQNAETNETLPTAHIAVELTRNAGGFHSRRPASHAAATNRMLQAVRFTLPEAGTYTVRIVVDGRHGLAMAEFPLDVAPAMPRWAAQWPWLFWPVIPIGLYVFQAVSHSHQRRRACGRAKRSSA